MVFVKAFQKAGQYYDHVTYLAILFLYENSLKIPWKLSVLNYCPITDCVSIGFGDRMCIIHKMDDHEFRIEETLYASSLNFAQTKI